MTIPNVFTSIRKIHDEWARSVECGEKKRHNTAKAATRAAYHLEQERGGERFDVYQCRWCGGWHIGHSWEEDWS